MRAAAYREGDNELHEHDTTRVCIGIRTCSNYVAVFNKQKKTAYIYFSIKTGFVSSARNSFYTFYFTWSQLQWRMLQRTVFIYKIRMLQRSFYQ